MLHHSDKAFHTLINLSALWDFEASFTGSIYQYQPGHTTHSVIFDLYRKSKIWIYKKTKMSLPHSIQNTYMYRYFDAINPLPHMPILGSSNSAANKVLTNGGYNFVIE